MSEVNDVTGLHDRVLWFQGLGLPQVDHWKPEGPYYTSFWHLRRGTPSPDLLIDEHGRAVRIVRAEAIERRGCATFPLDVVFNPMLPARVAEADHVATYDHAALVEFLIEHLNESDPLKPGSLFSDCMTWKFTVRCSASIGEIFDAVEGFWVGDEYPLRRALARLIHQYTRDFPHPEIPHPDSAEVPALEPDWDGSDPNPVRAEG